MRCFGRRPRRSPSMSGSLSSSGRCHGRSAWEPQPRASRNLLGGTGSRLQKIEAARKKKLLPSALDSLAPESQMEQGSRSGMRRECRVAPEPTIWLHDASTKCAARTRSKPTVVAAAEPPPGFPKVAGGSAGVPPTVRVPSAPPGPASVAAAHQAGSDKKTSSRSKTLKPKSELRGAAAANAFADLCGEMPQPPERSKQPSRRSQRASLNPTSCLSPAGLRRAVGLKESMQRKTFGLNAGAPYVVADANGCAAAPAESEPDSGLTAAALRQELTSSKTLPWEERKHIFMTLCRQWHPDKNPGKEEQATILFQVLQEEKQCFLAK